MDYDPNEVYDWKEEVVLDVCLAVLFGVVICCFFFGSN